MRRRLTWWAEDRLPRRGPSRVAAGTPAVTWGLVPFLAAAQRPTRATPRERAAQRPIAPGDQPPRHHGATYSTGGDATRSRLAGVMPESATRLVSLHDADARPIRKGRLGKPVEFGYKAQVVDNADGVILDHTVEIGNPADAPQLAPAIARITRRTGRPPRAVTADRGYGDASVEHDLHDLGVRTVVIPRTGKPGCRAPRVRTPTSLPRQVKWRTGCEGRINHLKRSYGWNRTELTGITGARTWCGHGVFAHNLVKIGALAA